MMTANTEDKEKEDLVRRLCDLIMQISEVLEKEDCKNADLLSQIAKNHGLSKTQLLILRHIVETASSQGKFFTIKDLAQYMQKTPPAIVPHINLLEDKGLVIRKRRRFDRRKVYLIPTKDGEKIAETLLSEETDPWFFPVLTQMPDEELTFLANKLEMLARIVSEKPETKV